MSSRARVRDVWSAPRDLSAPLVTRCNRRFPTGPRRDLTTVLIYRRVATTWLLPWPGWGLSAVGSAARNTLPGPPHGTAVTPARPWYFASTFPAAFSRPWQWTTSGLPCPHETSDHFPEPSDFSADTFHNRPTRKLKTTATRSCCSQSVRLFPAIHRVSQNAYFPIG